MNQKSQSIILAGGCFWGMEELLGKIPGVKATRVGYSGGTLKNPKYEDVKTGQTGHAESVRVDYDPAVLKLPELLDFFFTMHDPTTLNRQGNDRGSQYRSAIFYSTPEQKEAALTAKAEWEKLGHWKAPIITEVTQAGEFYPAEDYHQKYLEKNPGGYTCHYMRPFKRPKR